MSAGFTLRPAAPADAALMAALHAGGFDRPWLERDFAAWLARPHAFAVVLDVGGRSVGFALALAVGDDADLLTITVDPQVRRLGAGRALFAGLDAEAGRRGVRRWVLEAARNNLPALALYRGAGFIEIGVRKGYYPDTTGAVDAVVLARPVGGPGGHQDA